MFAGKGIGLVDGRAPQAGDDLELLLEPLEAFGDRGEGDPVGRVLVLEPARAEPEVHSATGHPVHLRDRDGEQAGVPERRCGHECAEPDRRRLPRQPGECDPRIRRPRQPVRTTHGEVVIGPEERGIPAILGTSRDGQLVVVGGPLLRLDEDPQFHGRHPGRPAQSGI